jgi:hypothetical protein
MPSIPSLVSSLTGGKDRGGSAPVVAGKPHHVGGSTSPRTLLTRIPDFVARDRDSVAARDLKGEIAELEFVCERRGFQTECVNDLTAGDDARRNLLEQARTNIDAGAHKGDGVTHGGSDQAGNDLTDRETHPGRDTGGPHRTSRHTARPPIQHEW